MTRFMSGAAFAVALIAVPFAVNAQGVGRGAADGAAAGERAAGPVGGAVGGVIGGVVGGATGAVAGILGVEQRPRFREYVGRERRPSYRYREEVRVGVVLPDDGVTYYDVPSEYDSTGGYRYTVVNDRYVLVDPRTRRIVDVID
ncbi:DUF1236 domain-containing protein [uncultured Enterovirga sp.]|uniref:DUF1236 domain-containing protein n=1 Tax=uncultured Enterovirga sp. TaxID=2026352 RepID=UPI0035CB137C